MASGRRGRWRYTRPVIVFAGGKSKNAASPDEERSSALSRFLLQVKRNNTRQSRTASSGEFIAGSGTPHPLLDPSRLLQQLRQQPLPTSRDGALPVRGFSQWRYVAHAAVSGLSHRLHKLRQADVPPSAVNIGE
jgi:hypothetical protein